MVFSYIHFSIFVNVPVDILLLRGEGGQALKAFNISDALKRYILATEKAEKST